MYALKWREWGQYLKEENVLEQNHDIADSLEDAAKFASSHEAIATIAKKPERATFGGGFDLVEVDRSEWREVRVI